CGSSNSDMPTFAAWEATVLEHAYPYVDMISLHAYYEEHEGDLASFLASAVDMDRMISTVVATADHVAARLRSPKRIALSFDEWNVWYQADFAGPQAEQWDDAPRLIEDTFNLADAVVVGDLLITLLRHADRVAVACQAQLVNVIAPIRTEPGGPAWRQTIFHPFALTARWARGEVLRLAVESPTVSTARYGAVSALDATATWDSDTGELAVFCVNRHPDAELPLRVDLRGMGAMDVAEALLLADSDVRAVNTADDPDRVRLRPFDVTSSDGGLELTLPPVSWAAVRLGPRSS
ncbi:MAG: alpha-L-arabinofuranosidase C-terminal domain-containing protein, partial [Actinomycetota bacterium]